ncbi:HD domain-containing protein [Arcobacter sp. FWKO B]|uniref:HD domain-containing protein n=1 Tax=Arcobacter sp. FWKO B TaxID=2593672 RepID=UPI001D181C92|nr:HD domain-containing protein [Arcobacter sp. FWKO B]
MTNRFINDTIFSHIEHTKFEGKILQTKILSRLQFVTQNALAYFAFPSINTKRYIHSLGTMHLASYMYKSALLNAKDKLRSQILDDIYQAIKKIEKEKDIKSKIHKSKLFVDDALYQFLVPLKDDKERYAYMVSLQAIRLCGLLHDVGHLPFSHQVEYALQSIYAKLSKQEIHNKEEIEFLEFYNSITNNQDKVLHEAMGLSFCKMLFEYEVVQCFCLGEDRDYIKVVYSVVEHILKDREFGGFDFGVLHGLIDSTVDADRLDYINRDMLASGYIGGAVDLLRIAKQSVLTKRKKEYYISFCDSAILDIEHMLEMRFNLYKKVIFHHQIARKDAMLESLIAYLANQFFLKGSRKNNDISMLWKFDKVKGLEQKLDTISLLDENWLISLFKEEYFALKYDTKIKNKQKVLMIFEEVLFGKKYFSSIWKNLNDLYGVLEFTTTQKYQFRESFGYISPSKLQILKNSLDNFVSYHESKEKLFLSYQIVSFSLGISKDFHLFSGEELVSIDEVSTLRKRLKKSMLNTVPFFIYCDKKELSKEIKKDLKELLFDVFERNREWG